MSGKSYAFDFFDTLTHHEPIRELARRLFAEGHDIHIVSSVSPGLPIDNDGWYAAALDQLQVPFTKVHRVDHGPELKVKTLRLIKADGFWDNDARNIAAALEAGFPSCLVGFGLSTELRTEPLTRASFVPSPLEELYQKALQATPADPQSPSDIYEHLPLLRELAAQCEHVTEFGTRRANGSTVALLCGQPSTFVTWDINPYAIISQQVADLVVYAGRTKFEPRVGDTLKISPIEMTDMLFIDSLHTATQLLAELKLHADPIRKTVRKYLVFHDTETFGMRGEDGSKPGLRAAIRFFQSKWALPQWRLKHDLRNCNGLVVLEAERSECCVE